MNTQILLFPRESRPLPFQYTVKQVRAGDEDIQQISIQISTFKTDERNANDYICEPSTASNTPDILAPTSAVECVELEECTSSNSSRDEIVHIIDEDIICDGLFASAPTRPLTANTPREDASTEIQRLALADQEFIGSNRHDPTQEADTFYVSESSHTETISFLKVIPLAESVLEDSIVVKMSAADKKYLNLTNRRIITRSEQRIIKHPLELNQMARCFAASDREIHRRKLLGIFSLRTHRGYILNHIC